MALNVPDLGSLSVHALIITALGFVLVLIFVFKWGVLRVLGTCAIASIALLLAVTTLL